MARPDLLDVLPFSDYADDDGNRLPMDDEPQEMDVSAGHGVMLAESGPTVGVVTP